MNATLRTQGGAMSPQSHDSSPTAAGAKRKRTSEPKFYAVRVGNRPGIYHTWDACLEQVKGHKNALFKSFTSLNEAEHFLAHGLSRQSTSSSPKFYAVQNGRIPGIYTDWPTAQQQVVGWSKPKHKSFSTYAEAEAFVRGEHDSPKNKTTQSKKKRKSVSTPMYGDELDLSVEPGAGLLPADAEDGFDSRIILNHRSGKINYKTEEQRDALKMQAIAPAPSSMLHIYTDGSSRGNGMRSARAGVGVFFGPSDPRNVAEPLAGPRQTNQRAELTAIYRALDIAPRNRDITIHSDSNYAIKCVTEWFVTWRNNGWMTAGNKPVENRDLVESVMSKLDERHRLRVKTHFEWVKGHSNDPGNVAADRLAIAGANAARFSGAT